MRRTVSIFILFLLCLASQAQEKKSPVILYIGDSITDGNWGRTCDKDERNYTDLNHIFGHGYMYICAATISSQYPERNYTIYNRGVSGNTISDMGARWEKDCLELQPDVLSVMIGINDVYRLLLSKRGDKSQVSIENYETKYRELLNSALDQNPNLKIVIIAPFIFKVGRYEQNWDEWNDTVRSYAAVAKKIAAEYNAVFIDCQSKFDKMLTKYPQLPASYWVWDGIHPTAAGHKMVSDMWLKAVKLPKSVL